MRAAILFFAIACEANSAPAITAPTYYRDVLPILQRECLECHVNDRVAPRVRFETAEAAAHSAGLIREAIAGGEMPLFGLDNAGHCGTFHEARWLDADELAILSAWIDAGAPAGDHEEAVVETIEPRPFRADLVLTPEPYTPSFGPGTVKCFVLDPALDRDRFLTAFEVEVDPEWSVEHVSLYEGDTCPEGARPLAASSWVDRRTGRWIVRLPEGTGVRMHAGQKLVAQIHFNAIAGIHETRTTIALELDDRVTEATLLEVSAKDVLLEPGLETTSIAGTALIRDEVDLLGVVPRMKFLGQSLTLQAVTPERRCLADAHHWNLHWFQRLYRYEHGVRLPAGSVLRIDCSYTTLSATDPAPEECRIVLYVTPPA
jgi:hypothetical protein